MTKHYKLNGIILLLIGVILLVWPGSTLIAFSQLLGWFLVICGIIQLAMGLVGSRDIVETAAGGICLLIGIVFITRPALIVSILPVVIGLLIVASGLAILLRILLRREQGLYSVLSVIGGLVAVIAGLILVFHPFTTVKLFMIVLGVVLIYYGILSIGRE